MRIKAVSKNTGLSPRKVRLLIDMVRGKKVEDALNILKFAPTPQARGSSQSCKISGSQCRE